MVAWQADVGEDGQAHHSDRGHALRAPAARDIREQAVRAVLLLLLHRCEHT